MDTYEVPVIGQGSILVDIFQAVAIMAGNTGSSALNGMLFLSALIGAGIALFTLATKASYADAGKWFIGYVFVFGVMYIPRVNVVVNDASDPSVVNEVITNVPIGLALPASFSTIVGNRVALILDTNISPVDSFNFTGNKALWGPRLLKDLGEITVTDARMAQNLNNFFQRCVFTRIGNDGQTFAQLGAENDLWPELMQFGRGNIAVNYQPSGGELESIGCDDAYTRINVDFVPAINRVAEEFGSRYYPEEENVAARRTSAIADAASAHLLYMDIARDGTEILRQSMIMNQFQRSQQGLADSAGGSASVQFAQARSRGILSTSAQTVGDLLQTGIPLLYTLLIILLVAIFPIVIVLGMIPGAGLKIIKNYLFSWLYIQAYPVLFIIFNAIINFELRRKSMSAFGATDTIEAGLTISRLPSLSDIPSETAVIAALFLTLIPLMMKIFTGGVSAVSSGIGQVTSQYQNAASVAAGEVSSGNIALGTTSYSTAQAFSFDTNASFRSGEVSTNTESGGSATRVGNGRTVVNNSGALSNLGVSSTVASSLQKRTGAARSSAVTATEVAENSRASSTSLVNGELLNYIASQSDGVRQTDGNQFSNIEGLSQSVSGARSAIQNFSQRHELSATEAVSLVSEVSAGGSLGVGGGANSASIGASFKLAKSKSRNAGTFESDLNSLVTQLNQNDALSQGRQTLASFNSTQDSSSNKTLSEGVSSALQSIDAANETIRSAQNLTEAANSFDERAFSESGNLNIDTSNDLYDAVAKEHGNDAALAVLSNPSDERFKSFVDQGADDVFRARFGESLGDLEGFEQYSTGDVRSIGTDNAGKHGSSVQQISRAHGENLSESREQFNQGVGFSSLSGTLNEQADAASKKREAFENTGLASPTGQGTELTTHGEDGLQTTFSPKDPSQEFAYKFNESTDNFGEGGLLQGANRGVEKLSDGSPEAPPLLNVQTGLGSRQKKEAEAQGFVRVPEDIAEKHGISADQNTYVGAPLHSDQNLVHKDDVATYREAYEAYEQDQTETEKRKSLGNVFVDVREYELPK